MIGKPNVKPIGVDFWEDKKSGWVLHGSVTAGQPSGSGPCRALGGSAAACSDCDSASGAGLRRCNKGFSWNTPVAIKDGKRHKVELWYGYYDQLDSAIITKGQCSVCNPVCNAPLCGQANGCGGNCSNGDNVWSSCNASYQRTNACVGTETCKGTVSGTVFDSTGGSCSSPTGGVAGVSVSVKAGGTPAAGCSLSGSSVTAGSGNYALANLCAPAIYLMTIDAPAGWVDTPAAYCDGGLSATLTSQGQVVDKDFGLARIHDSWLQVQDGDVYAAGKILNPIPPTCQGACKAQFILDGAGGDPGVAGYGGISANFGEGEVSSAGWLVNAAYAGKRYGFEFWRTHWNVSSQADSDWSGVELNNAAKPTSPPIHAKVYYADADMIIANSSWQVAGGEKIAVLVRGDLTIKAKISVAEGGFLVFAVQGDIKIDPTVNSEDGQGAVEGIYIADGEIKTGTANTKLILEGTFVGWQGVTLGRDFATVRNNTEAVEVFVYRPDIVAAAPKYMRRPSLSWEEVAP